MALGVGTVGWILGVIWIGIQEFFFPWIPVIITYNTAALYLLWDRAQSTRKKWKTKEHKNSLN